MPATPIYGFPYPGLGDSPHGPNQVEALAEAVEAALAATDADVAALAPAIHAYYYQSGTPQDIDPAADERVSFNNNLRTTPHVTAAAHGSGGTEFTLNKAGVWLINAAVKFATSVNDTERYLSIANSAALTTRYGQSSGPSNTATSSLPIGLDVSVCRPFAVGAKICALVFQGSAGSVALLNNYAEDIRISFTFQGD